MKWKIWTIPATILGAYMLYKNSGGILAGGSMEAQATNIIKHFEGFFADAYKCPAGVWTIGYGHVMVAGDPEHISEATAARWLREELQQAYIPQTKAALSAKGIDPEKLPAHQLAGIVSAVYNLGPGVVSGGTWTGYFPADMTNAGKWFKKWCTVSGTPLLGLVRRRFAEWQLIQTGKWQPNPPGAQEYYDSRT